VPRSVNHENVVRFYGACTKQKKYVIVTGDGHIGSNLNFCYLDGCQRHCYLEFFLLKQIYYIDTELDSISCILLYYFNLYIV